MAIIGTLPTSLSNGTTADASQVMADLNFIANQVNANAMAASNQSFPGLTVEGAPLDIDGAAGTNRSLVFQTGGLNRWIVEADSTAESGSTAGSNFEIISCTDAGGTGTAALTITRATNAAVFGGNITANSDERLKTDWADLPADFVERLASVRSGTYSRIDIDERQAGVGAQSLQAVLPEAVHESEKGVLSVAYGQAALVACVELAKEVMRLRALLETTK